MVAVIGLMAFGIRMWVNLPYIGEIRRGEVKPAKSTRFLFLVLTSTVLFVQLREFTSWSILFTLAEVISSLIILIFAFSYGYGGRNKIDLVCYVFFAVTFIPYLFLSDNAVLGLALLCITDFIAFIPSLVKNYQHPELDSVKYYTVCLFADGLAILAVNDLFSVAEVTYPLYLFTADLLAAIPLVLYKLKKGENNANDKHQVRLVESQR